MARQPIKIQPDEIPFAEAAPADDLQVEAFGEDEVLIGDPALDDVFAEPEMAFDANLAEFIDERELDRKSSMLVKYYEGDRSARSE